MTDLIPDGTPSMSRIMNEYASLMSLAEEDYHSPSAVCAEMLATVLALATDQRDTPLGRDIVNLIVPALKKSGGVQ